MQIKLKDHLGETQSGSIVDHQQWIVFADDVQVGYLPKYPNAYLQCIVSFDDATKAELIEAVSQAVNDTIGGVVMPVDPDDEPDDEDE
jgi:hypothetical protein